MSRHIQTEKLFLARITNSFCRLQSLKTLPICLRIQKEYIYNTIICVHAFLLCERNAIFRQTWLAFYSYKLRSLEVVGTILTSQNHPKCELNSHFGWFWLVKIAHKSRIWVDKRQKVITSSQPMYSRMPRTRAIRARAFGVYYIRRPRAIVLWNEIRAPLLQCDKNSS